MYIHFYRVAAVTAGKIKRLWWACPASGTGLPQGVLVLAGHGGLHFYLVSALV